MPITHGTTNKLFVVGITGAFGSGKSTASSYFVEKGFAHITLSSFLEEEAKKRHLPMTRRTLQDLGNEWRKMYGKEILAKKAVEVLREQGVKKAVIDGIRNVGEIEFLQAHTDCTLLAIVADRKVRYERLQQNKRREDLTWQLFTKLDYRDLGLGQKESGLRVSSCIALADVFIENNTTREAFVKRLEEFLWTHKID